MKGKFRKRPESVWCPKFVEKKRWEKAEKGFTKITENMPIGLVSMKKCQICDYLEEFDLDNNGVFCLYGIEENL